MTRWMLGLACCLCLLALPAVAEDTPPAEAPPEEPAMDVVTADIQATLEQIATTYDSDRTLLTSMGDEIAIHHHTIVATLDPAAMTLSATSTETVTAQMEARRIHFLLFHDFAIESITVTGADGTPVPVTFETMTLESDKLIDSFMPDKDEFIFTPMLTLSMIRAQAMRRQIVTLTLPRMTRMHEDLTVTTKYHGSIDRLHMDPFTTEAIMLPATDFWFPDVLGPLSTCDITVTMPESYHAFAPGKLLTDTVAGTSRTMHYHSDVKQGEIDVIAGEYTFAKEVHNGIDYYSFLFPKTAEHAMETPALAKAAEYVEFFAERVGPYPYEAFALVETGADTATGHPGFTLIGGHVINAHLLEAHTLGHEILHSWFGNWIYWGGEGGNWTEGITFYLANLYYDEIQQGPLHAREARESTLEDLSYITRWNDVPTINEFTANEDSVTQSIGYHKLGILIHGWRRWLGDEAFFDMLKRFVKEQAQQPTSINDLTGYFLDALKGANMIPTATDREDWIRRYSQTWYDTRTMPMLVLGKIELARDPADASYGGNANVVAAGFTPMAMPPLRVVAYDGEFEWIEFPADAIQFEAPSGSAGAVLPVQKTYLDTTVPWNGGNAATPLQLATIPDWVEFDPDYDQLRLIPDSEKSPNLRFLFHTGAASLVAQEATLKELNQLANLGAVFSRGPIKPGVATPLTATPDVVHDQNLFAVGTITDLPWITDLLTGPYGINEELTEQTAGEPIISLGDNDAIFRAWKNPTDPLTTHAVAIGKDLPSLAALLKKLPFYPMESEIVMQGGEVVSHTRTLAPTRSLRFPQK